MSTDVPPVSRMPGQLVFAILNPVALALGCFYLLVVATRVSIGYWPRYHYPDAGVLSQVPFPAWHYLTFALLYAAAACGPLAIVGLLVGKLRQSPALLRYSAVTLIMWVVLALVVWRDPVGFFDWFFD